MTASYVKRVTLDRSTLWKTKRPPLSNFDIELTERCNLNCVHCYINQPAGDAEIKAREMTTEQVKAVLEEAANLGAVSVRFTGGEPLLRSDFAELYLFARRLGLRVLLFTNATLLTPAVADLFTRVPPLEKVEITVYGMSAESYEAVTGVRGAFQAVHRGINLLQERQVPFVVKGTYFRLNKHEMQAFDDWARGVSSSHGPPRYAMFLSLRGRRDQAEKNGEIMTLRLTADETMQLLTREPARYQRDMQQFCSNFIGPPGDKLFHCGVGREFCVDAYGKVQPCMLLRDPNLVYDLYGQEHPTEPSSRRCPSLRDALENFFPQVREIRATSLDYLSRCARCFLHGLCEQCPAKSWMEHGTLDTPIEYECDIAHAQARNLGLLAEGERAWQVANWQERLGRLGTRTTDQSDAQAERG